MKATSIEGNRQKLDGGSMFGNAPRNVWERWITPDEQSRIPLACRSLLVQTQKFNVLFEAGIGAFFDPKMAERFGVQNSDRHLLVEQLLIHNLKPEDIDFVVLSHLHFDHAGGLLPPYAQIQSGNDQLIFPKAQYIVSQRAFDRAVSPHPRDRASFIDGLTEKLKNAPGLHLVNEDHPYFNIDDDLKIEFFFSDGHTPGQMLSIIRGGSKNIVYTGDLIPGTHWVHLPITMGYDRFPEKLIDEKQALFQMFDLNKTLFFYPHDPQFCCSHVEVSQSGRFSPIQMQESLESFEL